MNRASNVTIIEYFINQIKDLFIFMLPNYINVKSWLMSNFKKHLSKVEAAIYSYFS